MTAAVNEVGRCRCPVCGNNKARLRVSGKSLAYVVCNACQSQVFARSDASDERLRALHIPDVPAADEQPEQPEPKPAAVPVLAVKPAAVPVPAAVEKTEAAGLGWGIFR